MLITLLTHPREIDRKTNTGKLAINLRLAQRIDWERTQPNSKLLHDIATQRTALLYPPDHTSSSRLAAHTQTASNIADSAAHDYEHIIIIDATWQEARKIVNRSTYLTSLPRCVITPKSPSIFSLRRNQKEQGLCTAECVIAILDAGNRTHESNTLRSALTQFIALYGRN